MMKVFKGMLPYLVIILLSFYLLPFLIRDTGSGMAILLFAVPLICFVCSLIYGIKKSFHWLYAVIVAILFIPAIFIFYNSSAWIYTIIYGIIALFGNLIGMLLHRTKN